MNLQSVFNNIEDHTAKSILYDLVSTYMNPAFGVLPKKEIDLLFFKTLEQIGYISQNSSLYELVQKLKVTKAKARNLLYDQEIRRIDSQELDSEVKEILKNPRIQKDGDLYLFEVENPLLLDHFKDKVKKLGYLADGSFSPGIVRLPLNAIVALIDDALTNKEKTEIKKVLIKAGAPDSSFKGILKGVLKSIGKKIAKDAGEDIAEKAGDLLSPIIDASVEKLTNLYEKLTQSDE